MRYQISHKNIDLNDQMRSAVAGQIAKLEPLVQHFPEDAVHAQATVERHRRTQDFIVSLRLVLTDAVLVSREQRPGLETATEAAVEDVMDQLARHKSRLGAEAATQRAAMEQQPDVLPELGSQLVEERELFDRSMAGDEQAWISLSEYHLPAVTRALERTLREEYHLADESEQEAVVRRVLGRVMAEAQRDLARKPEEWSLQGWLIFKGRAALRDELGASGRGSESAA